MSKTKNQHKILIKDCMLLKLYKVKWTKNITNDAHTYKQYNIKG